MAISVRESGRYDRRGRRRRPHPRLDCRSHDRSGRHRRHRPVGPDRQRTGLGQCRQAYDLLDLALRDAGALGSQGVGAHDPGNGSVVLTKMCLPAKCEPRVGWWFLPPDIIKEFIGVLGFEEAEVKYHFSSKFKGIRRLLYTVVGHKIVCKAGSS